MKIAKMTDKKQESFNKVRTVIIATATVLFCALAP